MRDVAGEIRIGVIGAGGRGGLARHAHNPEDGVRLVAAADPEKEVLETFKEEYDANFVTADYRELVARDDIDAVFICSPDYAHETQAIAALETGKSVYLEKPLAITIEGCDRILEAACRTKGKLCIGHNMRHMQSVLTMKRLIDEGAIGQVKAGWCRHFVGHGGDFYFKDWHADRTKSNSLLLQKAAHDIDVLHWLCGGYSKRITGMGGLTVYGEISERVGDGTFKGCDPSHWPPLTQTGFNPVVDVEDLSMMLMQLDNGVFCSYQQCHYTPDYWRNYTIIGTEGRLENFGVMGDDAVVRVWNKRCGYNADGDITVPVASGTAGHGGADELIVAEFIRYLRGECQPSTSALAARYSVAAGCMAADSLRNGSAPRDVPTVSAEIQEYFTAT